MSLQHSRCPMPCAASQLHTSSMIMKHVRPLILFAGLACSVTALGREVVDVEPEPPYGPFEITPFGGGTFGGEFEDPNTNRGRDVKDSASFGLVFDFATEEPGSWYELYYGFQDTDVSGTSELPLTIQYLHIGGNIILLPEARHVIPYAGGGLGATLLQPDRNDLDSETRFSASLAGGVRIPINKRVGVRLEVRALFTFLDSDSSIFCASGAAGAGCDIRVASDTFVQYTTALGISAAF